MKNIVFIMTDDQTLNTIGGINNKEIITPTLKKLVEKGAFFNNAHFPSGTSGAMCMPSRAMIHSSKTLFELHKEGSEILKNDTTLGEVLINNGYKSHGIGKWHNGCESFSRSFTSGENIFFGGMWDHYNVPVNDFDYTGQYDNKIKYTLDFFNSSQTMNMTANKVNSGIHSTNMITDSAVKFLKETHNQPYFLYVSYMAPHDPRVSPQKYKDMYDLEKISVMENYLRSHPFDFGQELERDEKLLSRPFDENEIKKEIRDYYAMITHLDDSIKKIVDLLDQDTILVFTSDNGLCLSSHGLLGKQNHYEESIRVPLIFNGPMINKKVINNYVYLHDIYPTILDLVNIKHPNNIRGKSFIKMFTQNHVTRKELYFAYNDYIRSYKDEKYKIIIYRNGVKKEIVKLYDIVNDQFEKNEINDPKLKKKYYQLLLEYSSDWESDHYFTKSFFNKNELKIINDKKEKYTR